MLANSLAVYLRLGEGNLAPEVGIGALFFHTTKWARNLGVAFTKKRRQRFSLEKKRSLRSRCRIMVHPTAKGTSSVSRLRVTGICSQLLRGGTEQLQTSREALNLIRDTVKFHPDPSSGPSSKPRAGNQMASRALPPRGSSACASKRQILRD